MATVSDTDSYEDRIKCPICLKNFNNPKVLTCLHTFCDKCLSRIVSQLREKTQTAEAVECPLCGVPTHIPYGSIDSFIDKLPTNHVLLLQSGLGPAKEIAQKQVKCDPCDRGGKEKQGSAFCSTCQEHLCTQCCEFHKKFKNSMDHTILENDVQKLNTKDTHQGDATEHILRCSIHDSNLEYVCGTHKTLCCSNCAIDHHRQCENLVKVAEASKILKDRQSLKTTIDKFDPLKQAFKQLLKLRETNLNDVTEQKADIEQSIEKWRSKMIDVIDALVASSKNDLEKTFKEISDDIASRQADCKMEMAAVESSKMMLSEALSKADENVLFMMFIKVNNHLAHYIEKIDVMKITKSVALDFTLSKRTMTAVENMVSIGTISRTQIAPPPLSTTNVILAADFDLETIPKEQMSSSDQLKDQEDRDHGEEDVKKASKSHVRFETSGTKQGMEDAPKRLGNLQDEGIHQSGLNARAAPGKEKNRRPVVFSAYSIRIPTDKRVCDITSGFYLSGNRVVLCDYNNNKLKLFDKDFKYLCSCEISKPYYMCCLDAQTLALTSRGSDSGGWEGIKIFSVTDSFFQTRTIETLDRTCWDISSIHQDLFIHVSMYDFEESIQVYKSAQKPTQTIRPRGLKSSIKRFCISRDRQLIYCTTNEGIVSMDMSGKIKKISNYSDADGIIIGNEGAIYSCSGKENSVIRIPQHGGGEVIISQEDGVENPRSICLNMRNDKLLVMEAKQDVVKLYKIN
ncbi:hypothetical protein CHS0354_036759 [Potamilus streckersoni]|uniref:Uncharacterized protein n=1 Tax=Potamilus streckersoni TaxID=2493646 RepID=A0AAE0VQK7_9BIVA|nr:hypothetical protein CHS0354_036759 [Potamilus streckersoni]